MLTTPLDDEYNQLSAELTQTRQRASELANQVQVLRYRMVRDILGVEVGNRVKVTYKSGTSDVFIFGGETDGGNGWLYMETPRPNHLGERTIFLDKLQRGEYDGVRDFKIEIIPQDGPQ